eukprot:6111635-Pleurochrysis_carterae.AAC.1
MPPARARLLTAGMLRPQALLSTRSFYIIEAALCAAGMRARNVEKAFYFLLEGRLAREFIHGWCIVSARFAAN